MDPAPTAAGLRRPARPRHPAARSRVVAGLLSAVLFLGLGAGMAARQTSATTSSAAASSGVGTAQEDSGARSPVGGGARPGAPPRVLLLRPVAHDQQPGELSPDDDHGGPGRAALPGHGQRRPRARRRPRGAAPGGPGPGGGAGAG